MGQSEMPEELRKAIETIKVCCEEHDNCQSCPFHGYCGTEPYTWGED